MLFCVLICVFIICEFDKLSNMVNIWVYIKTHFCALCSLFKTQRCLNIISFNVLVIILMLCGS